MSKRMSGIEKPTEIIENLFVGDQGDGYEWKGARICVMESKLDCGLRKKDDYWAPLVEGYIDEEHVPEENLDKAAAKIDEEVKKGPTLLHCYQGIERSPLATAWYLHKYKGMSLEDAYELIKKKRPIIQRREFWIRPTATKTDRAAYDDWMARYDRQKDWWR